ncbi:MULTISPECIES: sodium-dependent transporter [unclassified Neptuniibacter]|uniref:sodium-dependent transporter n=1 Tax=unclassified Neptuniibacter TaxID=2630693 RepID=UPI000C35DDA2|nr:MULTISPECIES: sodium-dependent transporter [unclassified Neptuniibacter]MAY42774.1 sodium-dependent transporter [Oceanospirillaceae bacterium]|tara:strand:- start:11486 stop:12850 length:1365 start_codon:yes stop_codon:yes gene_type:complete
MQEKKSIHGAWASRWIFILAATGSAVGLGNIWKFPYITGENGGGAFVLVYLFCILLVGVPIMMAEVLIGRRGRQSPINAMKDVARESGHSGKWSFVGWMGVLAGFMIFSFYSVVAGWVLYYIAGMGVGDFIAIGSEDAGNVFNGLLADTQTLLIWHSIFVVMVMLVIVGGVKKGLENAVKFLMPALFVLLLVMLGYSMQTEGFAKGWSFLFHFDVSKLKWDSVLEALGHAFFTLSLGMGAIMAYGSYMPKKTSIGGSVIWIAIMDTLVALIAGLVIFPIVFTNGMDPGAGPGLMFVTLPVAFGQMPGGQIFGFVFFLLVGIAAWTSAISLMEPAAAWLVEKFGWHRIPACTVLGVIVWALGVAALGSFNFMSDVTIAGFNVFDFLDFMTANVMLPLGGLFIAIFAGWFMKRKMAENELAMSSPLLFNAWYIALRFIAPVAVATIFVINLVEKLK